MSGPRAYPKRPRFFANHFVRVLAKACLANTIGADGCWLLTVVALTEDAKGYRAPVTFFNEQLMPLVGAKNVKALDRIRARAVASGWLVYRAGAKGKAGSYWVEIPPEHRNWDDAPTDERAEDTGYSVSKSTMEPGEKREGSGEESGIKVGNNPGSKWGTIRDQSGQHSSYSYSAPISHPPLPPAQPGGGACDPPAPDFDPGADFNAWHLPLAELLGAWAAAGLPGHAAPGGIQETGTRRGHWQARLRGDHWRANWRAAVERAGRSARCRGGVTDWKLTLDAFLRHEDMVTRILEGEFDDGATQGGGAGGRRGGGSADTGRYAHVRHNAGPVRPAQAPEPDAGGPARHAPDDLFGPG